MSLRGMLANLVWNSVLHRLEVEAEDVAKRI